MFENTNSSPQKNQSLRFNHDYQLDRELNKVIGIRKKFFMTIRKILPDSMLRHFLKKVDPELIAKKIKDRDAMNISDIARHNIAKAFGDNLVMPPSEVEEIYSNDASPVEPSVITLGKMQCHFNLPKRQGLTPIFHSEDQTSETDIASVNAGDHDCHIGGGGINKAFGDMIPFKGSSKRRKKFMEFLHSKLESLEKGKAESIGFPGKFIGLSSTFLLKDNLAKKNLSGSVAIFEYAEHPNKNPKNKAMVYVVPPKRSDFDSDDDFLNAVQETANNMVKNYNKYAADCRRRNLSVPTLRVSAFSSDLYAGGVSSEAVARSIIKGIKQQSDELEDTSSLNFTDIQFSSAFDEQLRRVSSDKQYLSDLAKTQRISTQGLNGDTKTFIDFLNGETSINGHTRTAISRYKPARLEQQHNFIQAIFPNETKGKAKAPLLTQELIDILKHPDNASALKKYLEDMLVYTILPFWGIKQENHLAATDGVDFSNCHFSVSDPNLSKVWRTKPTDHNQLRVTRVLKFLNAVGYGDYAKQLCEFMQRKRTEMQLPENKQWSKAVEIPLN